MHTETQYNPELEDEEDDPIEEALIESGLSQVKALKPGSPVYQRLIEAARGYINEVKSGEKVGIPQSLPSNYSEREDYYRPSSKKPSSSSSSDSIRREYHDKLSIMLLGKSRKDLSRSEANQISNFAAYVTGEEGYVDTWR